MHQNGQAAQLSLYHLSDDECEGGIREQNNIIIQIGNVVGFNVGF